VPSLSVIIPTYKRTDILRECLRHLDRQTVREDLEVIVVSDGHDEQTAALRAEKRFRVPITFLEVEKSHQGVARNRGVAQATSSLCLFIGDDIFLREDACEHHLIAHRRLLREEGIGTKSAIAVLGFTTWDPAIGVTPVMRWLETSGWQFGYPFLRSFSHTFVPRDRQHLFTYTSHISLPTSIARAHPFLKEVSLYGWEDIEWGMRLRDAGVRLSYEPDAQALHHHHMTLEQSLTRMETLGASAVMMKRLVPRFDRLPQCWKKFTYIVGALLPTMAGAHRRAFLRGMRRAG